MTITVRQAVLEDVDEVAALLDAYRVFHGQASDLAGSRAFLIDRFDHGESVVFIAQLDARTVAFTQLYPAFSSWALKRTLILNDMYVTESCRQMGVGQKLLAHAAAYARGVGAVRLTLTTEQTNAPAQSLYTKSGWRQDPRFCVFHLDPME